MRRERNPLLTAYALAVYVFLFAPIVVLIIFSFNDSKRNFVWRGFTLRWYPELFANDALLHALGRHPPGRGHLGGGDDGARHAPRPRPRPPPEQPPRRARRTP